VGPIGPVMAIIALASVIFVFQQAITHQKMLTNAEMIAAALGTYGAFIMVVP